MTVGSRVLEQGRSPREAFTVQDSVARGWSWPLNQIFFRRQLPLAHPDLLAQDAQSQRVLTLPSWESGMRGAEEFTYSIKGSEGSKFPILFLILTNAAPASPYWPWTHGRRGCGIFLTLSTLGDRLADCWMKVRTGETLSPAGQTGELGIPH